jgi:hypothetical protein
MTSNQSGRASMSGCQPSGSSAPLVISLSMEMLDIFAQSPPQGTLTEDRLRAHRPTEVSNFAQTQLD